uniref:Putative secreted protein n=1 Tax=Ixodes ricinus TaxID=34613 RepID=A0A6B0UTF3_IXORI
MGYCLQPLHLAWCLAVSAAARRCSTGSQTRLWGSCRSQLRKWAAWISLRPAGAAFSKQLRTLGSMLEPPNAAISPSNRGSCTQSWSSRPSCLSSAQPLASAIRRKRYRNLSSKFPLQRSIIPTLKDRMRMYPVRVAVS